MINEIVRQLTAVVRERNMTKCVARYVIYSFRRASAYYYSLPPHQDRKLLVRMHTHTNIVTYIYINITKVFVYARVMWTRIPMNYTKLYTQQTINIERIGEEGLSVGY